MPSDLFVTPAEPSGLFVRVAVERGVDYPDGLTYSVPVGMEDLKVGERIRAPLGRSDRPVEGYVIQIAPDLRSLSADLIDPKRIKALLARAGKRSVTSAAASSVEEGLLGPGASRLPASLITLAQWISQYYCCPIGLTLASMTPAAVKKKTGTAFRQVVHRLKSAEAEGKNPHLAPSARRAWDRIVALEESTFPLEPRALADLIGERTISAVNRLVKAGLLTATREEHVRVRQEVQRFTEAPLAGTLIAAPPKLTPAQAQVVKAIGAAPGTFRAHLLYGVTGSGKTEVYLRVLHEVIERGESAIVLVPEISLTPQTASRFTDRFSTGPSPVGVAVLHSGLTAAQRHKEWMRVASGEARIVIGARSAIFAPFDPERGLEGVGGGGGKLGLIIVDEEHDQSYKQDQAPRYHARDVALRRGQLENCPVLLGTATPSLESWHNATPVVEGGAGRFELHRLPDRVAGGRLPKVQVVDIVEEQRKRESGDRKLRSIGPTLEHAIGEALERETNERKASQGTESSVGVGGGGRIMLLLNRRGYANYICCPDQRCGWFLTCNHCDVTAVYHKKNLVSGSTGIVRCHHCLAEQRLPQVCPTCTKNINTFGFGTQRVEEELASLFPELAVEGAMLRLDGDSMRRAGDYFTALDQFRRGEARLLLGTQMIAKGLDFPDVELIGVINADTAINLPDFRASERTFSLVNQVAGRAGRSHASARRAQVIVQTFNPSEPAITHAAAHDFESFAAQELAFRREAGLPPVGRMARIVCRDEDAAKARLRITEVFQSLSQLKVKGVRIRPPAPCPISRIAGHYRWAIELLATSPGPIQSALAALRGHAGVRSDIHTAVDVDPVALL